MGCSVRSLEQAWIRSRRMCSAWYQSAGTCCGHKPPLPARKLRSAAQQASVVRQGWGLGEIGSRLSPGWRVATVRIVELAKVSAGRTAPIGQIPSDRSTAVWRLMVWSYKALCTLGLQRTIGLASYRPGCPCEARPVGSHRRPLLTRAQSHDDTCRNFHHHRHRFGTAIWHRVPRHCGGDHRGFQWNRACHGTCICKPRCPFGLGSA